MIRRAHRLACLLYTACLALATALPAAAAPSSRDPTYANAGFMRTGVGESADTGNRIAVHADGRFVVAGFADNGSFNDMVVSRFLADGTLDATFGQNGHAILRPTPEGGATANALLIDAAGRYLVGGSTQTGNPFAGGYESMVVARLTSAGAPDVSFGSNGFTVINWGVGGSYVAHISELPDNRLLLTGSVLNAGRYEFAAARLTSGGAPDTTFDGDGRVNHGSGSTNNQLSQCAALQADGKILMGGYDADGTAFGDRFLAKRLNADGSLDATFGGSGSAFAGGGVVYGCALQADGAFAMSGYRFTSGFPNTVFTWKVARLTSTGGLDATFNGGGQFEAGALVPGSDLDIATTILQQGDGKLLVAGYTTEAAGKQSWVTTRLLANGTFDLAYGANGVRVIPVSSTTADDFLNAGVILASGSALFTGSGASDIAVARVTSAGAVDTAFATSGVRKVDVANGRSGGFRGLLMQGDGKAVLGVPQDAAVVRLLANGARDASFGVNGYAVRTNVIGLATHRIALAPGGAVVAAGSHQAATGLRALVSRFAANGAPDTTFAGTGLDAINAQSEFYDAALQSDGKVVAVGVVRPSGVPQGIVARFTSTGALDTTFNGTGLRQLTFGGQAELRALAIQPDQRIVVAGAAISANDTGIARLLSDGTIDPSLPETVIAMSPQDESVRRVLLQPDGKILLAGSRGTADGTIAALARLTANGAFDTTFGNGGIALDLLCRDDRTLMQDAILQADGKIVLAGFRENSSGGSIAAPKSRSFAKIGPFDPRGTIARWNADGSVDGAFTARTMDLAPQGGAFNGVAQQADGRLLVAGAVGGEREGQAFVLRLRGGASLAGGPRHDMTCDSKADITWRDSDGQMAAWFMDGKSAYDSALFLGPFTGWSVTHNGVDLNADGNSDLVWAHTDGSVALWTMKGLDVVELGIIQGPGTGWSVKHAGDMDGDGRGDLVFEHTDGSVAVWLMRGLQVLSTAIILGPGTGYTAAQLADFNGDGRMDVLFRNTNGSVSLWTMNGVNVLASAVILGSGTAWIPAHAGDLDGDGNADIVWRNTASNEVAVWLMNGIGIVDSSLVFGPSAGLNAWQVTHVADFDDDGRADLLWRNSSGVVALWLMNGLGVKATTILLGGDSSWQPLRVRDYNGDGMADILWRNTADGTVAMWLMKGLASFDSGLVYGGFGGWVPTP